MSSLKLHQQRFDYFLVLDFEATCEQNAKIQPQEIIEFPVLKVNGTTWETESIFHQYVRPVHHPRLTTFCTELTGIIQNQVDEQPDFIETFRLFEDWMHKEKLLDGMMTSVFVTCGDWDLKTW
ncbi:hypothetical protein HELRODRAFT_164590 [Helobdella robusta]|uniref:Exonuclease domain-containing protein n=1 Tax=Helobdella robusta TaxID=6412 RepID=T1EVL9_HELRO|nr:hypothetical protein HELRODRAFT_164590 [Helobdella robusta]ESN94704.1 hypothetical protein HELRODRAFT_164590 [Helobdella robusta]